VRENNKNKHGIDKNSNHRVTQKVWRLPGGDEKGVRGDSVPRQKQQYQEKDKNMHSVTSRRQERQGPRDDDITKVKTLQDATLKASRLYGMMRDFIHPSKINYQKIHSKWRNVKKQVQVGGDKIMFVSPKAGTAGPVDDDKDCLELPPKLSLHVTAHPDDPKKFIVKRLPGDPLIERSLTTFAEGLMGHLDKMKTGTEFDMGDADILALIARDLILLILGILGGDDDDDDDDDDDGGGEERKRLLAAALKAESRNAAAAAIIIALIGLIKNKDDAGDADIESVDGRDATIRRLRGYIRELEEMIEHILTTGVPALIQMGFGEINRLQEEIRQKNNQIQALRALLVHLFTANAQNEAEVDRLRNENQELVDALRQSNEAFNRLRDQFRELENDNDALAADNNDLRGALEGLREQLDTSRDQNAALQEQLQEMNQELEAQRDRFNRREQGFRQQAARQRDIIATKQREIAGLQQQNATTQQENVEKDAQIAAAQEALDAARRELGILEAADQAKNAQLDQLDERVRDLQDEVRRLGGLGEGHAAELAAALAALNTAQQDQAAAQAELERTRNRNTSLNEDVGRKDAEIADLQRDLGVRTTAIRDLETNLARLDAASGDHGQEIAQKKAELEAAREAQAANEARIQALEEENQRARDANQQQLETSATQLAALTAEHNATKDELDEATQRARDLQLNLDALGSTTSKAARELQAEIDRRQEQVANLTRQSAEENELLGKFRKEVAEIRQSKADADSENARTLQALQATRERHAAETRQHAADIAEREATIGQLKGEVDRLRREMASRPVSPPPPEVVDDSKLSELRASLREELDGAARSATDNLEQVFGTGSNAQELISKRKTCVARNKGEIIILIAALTLDDALKTTDETPVQEVKTIKHRIQLIREMCKSKLRTFIVQRAGGDSFSKTGAMIRKKPEEVPPLRPFKQDATHEFQATRQREYSEQVEQSKQNARKWGPFSDVYDTADNQTKFQGIETLIDDVPSGKVVVIFGYGYSGSGKTYTLFGNDDTPGIAQLAIEKYAEDPRLRVHFKNIRELYNCTYQAADGTKAGVKSEFYYKDTTLPEEFLSREFISDHGTSLTRETFNETLKKVETTRRTKGHIFPTHNNPQSSRGHLFVELQVRKDQDPPGYLIFCDMGGREDPNEMWNNTSYKYCSSSKLPTMGEPIIPGPIVRGDQTYYYNFPTSSSNAVMIKDMDPLLQFIPPSNERAQCNSASFKVTTYQAVKNSASDKHTGLDSILQLSAGRYKSAAFIMKTLREAFYINDSINHLLDHFEYYETPEGRTKKKVSNWDTPDEARIRAQEERKAATLVGRSTDGISATRRYYPDIFASISQTVDGRGDPIGMKAILSEYYNKDNPSSSLAKNPDHIRYCTFACIRTEEEFEEDSKRTLEFASQVNSCKNADCDAAACSRPGAGGVAMARGGLGGGAKTHRNRTQGKIRTQRRRRRIVKPKSHPVTAATTQRRNMPDKKKGHRTRKMK
jgi:hypothetical protein